jgi:uncharacterized protein (TIGR02145 family)
MKKLIMLLAIVTIMVGCKPEEAEPEKTAPIVKTGTVTVLSNASALVSAELISNGGSPIVGKGICWGTNAVLELIDYTMNVAGPETVYSLSITGLNPATVYYARAYAANKVGTSFGEVVSFTTLSGTPLIVGESIFVTEILSADLKVKIMERGAKTTVTFDYGTSPDLLNKSLIANLSPESGTDELTFTAHMTDLTIGEIYYVRAHATNVNGTTLGSPQSFRPYVARDIDGNLYHAVKIGDQVWLQENLQVEHYNDGSPIANVTDNTAWIALTTGAYCYYDNNRNNKAIYGALYNFFAVDTKKLAPVGWHVPSDSEWTKLHNYLGNPLDGRLDVAGAKLKEAGFVHWQWPNIGATNETGFTALPGGSKNSSAGVFGDIGINACFWSSTSFAGDLAWDKVLRYESPYLQDNGACNQRIGLSVRCVKD